VADSKLTALTEISVPALEDLFYTVDDPSGTPVGNKITGTRLGGLLARGICQGRLTTESGVPVSSSDRTSQGTIYFTPYNGNLLSLYDGTRWKLYTFSQFSLALTATSGSNYDVFVYDNAGTLTLELSGAWTNDTTRADALTTQDGISVKSGATTRRWVGTIRASGANVTEDSKAKRFVWNAYSQVRRLLTVRETDDTWNYTTGTWREKNGGSNRVELVCGDAALVDAISMETAFLQNNSTRAASVGIGVDSTTAPSGLRPSMYNGATTTGGNFNANATYRDMLTAGYHFLAELEFGADGVCEFKGDNGNTEQQSGLDVVIIH
jgi:hypothetical protein